VQSAGGARRLQVLLDHHLEVILHVLAAEGEARGGGGVELALERRLHRLRLGLLLAHRLLQVEDLLEQRRLERLLGEDAPHLVDPGLHHHAQRARARLRTSHRDA